MQRVATQFANTLGDRIGHGIKLIGLFIENQVIAANVRAAHVAVKIPGLQIDGEYIGEDAVHRRADIARRCTLEIGWRHQRGTARLHARLSNGDLGFGFLHGLAIGFSFRNGGRSLRDRRQHDARCNAASDFYVRDRTDARCQIAHPETLSNSQHLHAIAN